MDQTTSKLTPVQSKYLKIMLLGGKCTVKVLDKRSTPHVMYTVQIRWSMWADAYDVFVDHMYTGRFYFEKGDALFPQGAMTNPVITSLVQQLIDSARFGLGVPDPEMDIFHIGNCGYCGRPLTDPESIFIGLGPTCRKRITDRHELRNFKWK